MSNNNGGPAFPMVAGSYVENGMTLRDWFAGQASNEDVEEMQASKPAGMINRQTARYMCADAMIAERNREVGE